MDLSAFIFVALAVAWAVYLVPKALKHHDEVQRSRSVERFSASMRVLARREPVSRRDARLVVTPSRRISIPLVQTKASRATTAEPTTDAATPTDAVAPKAPDAAPVPPSPQARRTPSRSAAALAARRRRRVLGVLVVALAAVVGTAAFGVVGWAWTAVPGGLLVAWLVACRLMVRSERRARVARPRVRPVERPAVDDPTGEQQPVADDAPAAVVEVPADPDAWDMVPTTLPTYVSAPAAVRRTVQTIDLDSTGVWSSGRHAGDSALAREAEESERAARDAAERRVAGS